MTGVVGIDIGGTFTDIVHVDVDTGAVTLDKVPSRHGELHTSVKAGFDALRDRHSIALPDIATVVHGTTVATNAMLENRLPPAALIVTRGFGDMLEIGTMLRPRLYDLRARKPAPLAPRERVIEAVERLDAQGGVVVALTDDEIARVVAQIGRIRPAAVAISLLFSFVDDRHERRIEAALRRAFPDLPIAVSAEVDPQPREYPRANTAVLNASLNPLIADYVARFARVLEEIDGERVFYVMQSNGGLIPPSLVPKNAHRLVLSGPAGGVVAAQKILAEHGEKNLITFDMGGTSADLCLVVDGKARLQLAPSPLDLLPIRTDSLSVHAVGAGGGSIATVDEDGNLSVGPRSAGSIPGPVCYAQGGAEPTVTDAQLVLGRLSPLGLLGGDMPVDRAAADAAIRAKIAEPLGLSVEAAACAIVDVAVATMERGLRVVSINAGYDPRDFALVAYGGGGPLHGADLALAVGIARVIVPPASSAFSALGLLCADLVNAFVEPVGRALARLDEAEIAERFKTLSAEADALAGDGARVDRFVDMRYVGQNGVIRIDAPDAFADGLFATMAERFRAEHLREFGHASVEDPIELAALRVIVTKPWSERPISIRSTDEQSAAPSARRVYFAGRGWIDCPVLARGAISSLGVVEGPVIIEDRESTTVVPFGARCRTDAQGSLVLELQS
jgi:N-methylhydantoinase A